MKETTTQQKLKWWPSLQDYNEAIQIPQLSLQDADLKNGAPYTTPVGLPRAVTGAFASVYRMHCDDRDYALRFFLKNIENQSQRYALISDFIQHDSLPWTISFDFLEHGVLSRGEWFPALKMDWVEGQPFEEYLIDNLQNTQKLADLADAFVLMMTELHYAGIAHGDLQHGNIIMCGNELRLVDYDGMFVPSMQNFMANELGHPNYQHPKRSEFHFGPYLDNFSAWVIYVSLKGLQQDPALLNQLGGADDCLLFRKSDFLEPLQSPAFAAFENHQKVELQKLGRFLRSLLELEVHTIPYLRPSLADSYHGSLEPIADGVSCIKNGPRLERGEPSDWLDSDNLDVLSRRAARTQPAYGPSSGQRSWIVQPSLANTTAWVKPAPVTETVPPIQPTTLPIELAPGAKRTGIKFTNLPGAIKPWQGHLFMFLNPLLYVMLYYLFNVCTIDENLRRDSVAYNATIFNVTNYDVLQKSETVHHTEVTAKYFVDGKPYIISNDFPYQSNLKKGEVYPVHALPSHPETTEPFGSPVGTRQKDDLQTAGIWLLFNLFLEIIIWARPLMHWNLAKYGEPVFVSIKDLYVLSTGKTVPDYWAVVEYESGAAVINQKLSITAQEYKQLKINTIEIGLIEPMTPTYVVLYKFLLFKPTAAP